MPFPLFRSPHDFLYRKRFGRTYFYIRQLKESDIGTIHHWVTRPYARRFWQMDIGLPQLQELYFKQQTDTVSRSFLLCQGEVAIALFEVYHVVQSELKNLYASKKEDYGIHLLMAPPEQLLALKNRVPKMSECVLRAITEMLLASAAVTRVVAEPDVENQPAHKLAEKVGFVYQHDIELPDKRARLYLLDKEAYTGRPVLDN